MPAMVYSIVGAPLGATVFYIRSAALKGAPIMCAVEVLGRNHRGHGPLLPQGTG